MKVREWLAACKPGPDTTSLAEKFRSSFAALAGTLLLGWGLHLLPGVGYPLSLLASMAAASVLLYAVPHSPMAQPWPLVAGNLLSGVVGWACSVAVPDAVVAASLAVGLSILVMHLTRSLHPPGAGTAIAMVLSAPVFQHHGWLWAACVVLANALLSLLAALLVNNLAQPGRYPARRHTKPESAPVSATPAFQDVEWALRQMEGVADVSQQDMLEIYRLASERARNQLTPPASPER